MNIKHLFPMKYLHKQGNAVQQDIAEYNMSILLHITRQGRLFIGRSLERN